MSISQTCIVRELPEEKQLESAKNAIEVNPKNLPTGMDPDNLDSESASRLAIVIRKWWGESVDLPVGFMDEFPSDLRTRILSHMNAWGRDANVQFRESSVDPVVRIARLTEAEAPKNGGYWSYVGTDVVLISADQPTLNLEGFTMNTPESEFLRVVRHEAGHTLGCPHEHMRTELVQRLDREKVIESYMASQNWSRQDVIDQVLTPLEESSILGTPVTDDTSIMCYQIDGSLTLDGNTIPGGTDINELDHQFISQVYPKV